MSLDKAIMHGKERRKPYTGSKSIDKTCRNHGGCPWCEENRKHKFRDKHPERMGETMDKDSPIRPIIAEDFDGPPGFYFEVCPGCHCAVNYLEERCHHCGQALAWKETEE